MKDLLIKVNEKIKEKPIIFFSREVERALGLEHLLENYFIACVEENSTVNQLIDKYGDRIFCLEKHEKVENKSTNTLFKNDKFLAWIKGKAKDGFYGMTLFPHQVIFSQIKKLGGELLSPEYLVSSQFENKILATKLFQEYDISTPNQKIVTLNDNLLDEIKAEYSYPFVIQTEKGHTGNSTFIINNENDLNDLINKAKGNTAKIAEFVDGIPMTINCLVNNKSTFISSLQYQITGIKELTNTQGTTVGNDFSYANEIVKDDLVLIQIVREMNKVARMMKDKGYFGLFGVDFILKENEVFVIEINARQTANIPFQTQLELLQTNQPPLLLLSIASNLGIDISLYHENYQHLYRLNGAQVFLRAKSDNIEIIYEPKTGLYRLQSDNSAMDWDDSHPSLKENVIFLDEEQDKPLIFQSKNYKVEEGMLLLLFSKQGSTKNKTEEVARIQFLSSAFSNDSIKPWILEMFQSIEAQVL